MRLCLRFKFSASILTFMILALFLTPASRVEAANRAGEIVLIKGDVFILDVKANIVADPQGRRGRQTKVGAEFFEGETVSTKVGARVKLRFDEGGNEIVLGSDTTLLIERAGGGGAKKGTSLNLSKGEVRSDVKIKYSGQGADVYEVKSKNAVAGVRGTIFVAMLDKSQNFTVATERGAVFVQSTRTDGGASSGYRVNAGQFVTSSSEGVAPPKPVSSNPELKATIESLGGGKSDKSESKEGSSASSSSENRSGDGEKTDSESTSSSDGSEKSDKQDKAEQKEKSEKSESADSKDSSSDKSDQNETVNKKDSSEKSDKKEVSDSNDSASSSSDKKETADKKESGDRREKSDKQAVAESNEKKTSDSQTASNDSSSSRKESSSSNGSKDSSQAGSKDSSRSTADNSRSTASTENRKTTSTPPGSVQDVAGSSAPPLGQEKVTPAMSSSFGSGKTDFKSGSGSVSMTNNPAAGTTGGRAPASTAPVADSGGKPTLMVPGGGDGGVNGPAVGSTTGGVYMGPPPTTGVPSFVSEPAKSALDNAAAAQKTYTNDKATSSQTGTVKVIIR